MKLRDPRELAEYLAMRGMSQADLGRAAGVSRQFIHQLVNGKRRCCEVVVGQRIEKALGLLPNALFDSLKSRPDGHIVVTSTTPTKETAA